MSSSAFTPTVLTIGSAGGAGELNVINNPSGALGSASGWIGATASTTISPLAPTVSTSLVIANTAAAEGPTSGGYYTISQLPSGLQNRKLKVEFYYTTPATDVYKVSVYKGSTRVALSTDSSGSTTLPANSTGKFVAYFDTDASASWSLNVTRTSGTTGPCYITNMIVGPGIQPQGLAGQYLGQLSLTPSNFGTVSAARFDAWRVGSRLRVVARFNNGTSTASVASLALPSGYTIDSSALPTSTQSVGTYVALRTTTASIYSTNAAGVVFYDGSDTSNLYFATNSGAVSGTLNKDTGGTVAFTNGGMDITFEIPIAQWAGSGTVQLAQNDVEYAASTSGTWDAAASAAQTVYGPDGAPISGSLTAQRNKVVRFQTPIQAGDKLVLELNNGNGWASLNDIGWAYVRQGAFETGASVSVTNSTDITVSFYQYSVSSNTGYGVASGATNWPSGYKWRVRKSSAGAAVGFGIADANSAGLVNPYTTGSGVVYSGTYTPTLTAVSGGVSGTPQVAQYMRVGRVITVSGTITSFAFTASSNVECRLSLPVTRAANFTISSNAGGSGVWARGGVTIGGIAFQVYANTSSSNQVVVYTTSPSGSGTADTFTYQFTYSLD